MWRKKDNAFRFYEEVKKNLKYFIWECNHTQSFLLDFKRSLRRLNIAETNGRLSNMLILFGHFQNFNSDKIVVFIIVLTNFFICKYRIALLNNFIKHFILGYEVPTNLCVKAFHLKWQPYKR